MLESLKNRIMKKYLITGAAGFIGSHLCEKLVENGHSVVGIDSFDDFYPREIKEKNIASLSANNNFELIEGDIRDDALWDTLENTTFDGVFHLAARAGVRPSIEDPGLYLDVNVYGTQKLLDWMVRSKNYKLIFASSSSIYGNNKSFPFKETDPVDHPISPYAYTKKACELMIHTYHHLYGIDAMCLRFFTVYGPRQRPDLAINKFFNKILNDEPIDVYGDGYTSRDYTYIDDLIEGVLGAYKFIEDFEAYEVVNLGSNSPVLLTDLIHTIEIVCKKEAILNHMEMQAGDVDRTYACIEKAKEFFDYKRNVTLLEGLDKYYKSIY